MQFTDDMALRTYKPAEGYYTSEVGFEDELHEEIIPSDHAGCVPLEMPKGTS